MKRLLAILALAFTTTAFAHGPGRYYGPPHHHHSRHWDWVVPAVVGGAIVYGMTRPQPPQPVVVQPPPVVYVPQGLPPAPVGYKYEQILDANCNCYRWVLIQG